MCGYFSSEAKIFIHPLYTKDTYKLYDISCHVNIKEYHKTL